MSEDMNLEIAPAWRPTVGDVLVGEVTDVNRGWSDQAEKYYPIITVQPEKPARILKEGKENDSTDDKDFEYQEGPVAVHCFHTVLYMRMVELRPELGNRIGVKYVSATEKSKVKGTKGNTPAIYNVRIDGRASDVWDAMEQDPRLVAAKAKNAAAKAATDVPPLDLVVAQADVEDDDIPF